MPDAEASLAPAWVLDASAVMALLHDEQGSSAVVDAIAEGAVVSVVNWAEVLSNVAADGNDPREVASRLGVTGNDVVIGGLHRDRATATHNKGPRVVAR